MALSLTRYCVVSDIHGNLPALEAVLADAARRGFDQLVDLGDSLSGPLWPAETAERLEALRPIAIRGNHERQVLTLGDRMGESDAFTAARLRSRHIEYIEALPAERELPGRILMVHGSPRSDVEYFMEILDGDQVRPRRPSELMPLLGNAGEQRLILCGHTHIPRAVQVPNGPLIVNPGSVGLQAYEDDHPVRHVIENGQTAARYAIVTDHGRAFTVSLLHVAYDHESAARKAENEGRPDWAIALRTGRMSPA
ncbi:metallophosphoesterase family protein [Lacibacterium aquatile]|uniref:Metallophosphoesterase family protein n=1 Tax=Lacibacterium aquatile TaxID=1168082 RepID=A0ABW5DNQ4_9PROT